MPKRAELSWSERAFSFYIAKYLQESVPVIFSTHDDFLNPVHLTAIRYKERILGVVLAADDPKELSHLTLLVRQYSSKNVS